MEPIEIEILNILKQLKLLDTNKPVAEDIAKQLSQLFKVSKCTKGGPTDWKTAFVIPLFKKGNKASAENYNPISITSAVANILERVVYDSVMMHLKLNGILLLSQHGVQPKKSIETNLPKTYDVITDMLDQHLPVDILLLDLSKAFDKVLHSHLNKKLISSN
ncbi:uncharacterized protein LOC136025811 [Artemia franciscana]|uniref:uncharacterized protein LOC136025811 n=1 Tax=Artemia franciscana TaxID=6661 RepID=UPI0032DBDDC8